KLVFELAPYGLDEEVMRREVEYLAKAKCLVTEDYRTDQITEDDLIRLAPAGFVHLELMANAYYWGAIAEDTWFTDDELAKAIAERIGEVRKQYQPDAVLYNATDVVKYLEAERAKGSAIASSLLDHSRYDELTDLSMAQLGIARLRKSMTSGPWVEVFDR